MRVISPIATLLGASLLSLSAARQVPATPQAAEAPGIPRGERGTRRAPSPATHAGGPRSLARRIPALCARARRHRGWRRRRRQGRRGPAAEGLRLRRRREEAAGGRRGDAVPPGLGLQALHLDRRHAAGRARQARPRRRRQPVPRLRDSAGPGGRAGAGARPHDPHGGIRGGPQGADLRGPVAHCDARGHGERLGAGADLRGRHDARLLELRHGPCRLPGRAHVRALLRRLPRPEHLRAARHAALQLSASHCPRPWRPTWPRATRSPPGSPRATS